MQSSHPHFVQKWQASTLIFLDVPAAPQTSFPQQKHDGSLSGINAKSFFLRLVSSPIG